jgi:hypothetical protein
MNDNKNLHLTIKEILDEYILNNLLINTNAKLKQLLFKKYSKFSKAEKDDIAKSFQKFEESI